MHKGQESSQGRLASAGCLIWTFGAAAAYAVEAIERQAIIEEVFIVHGMTSFYDSTMCVVEIN